MRKRESEKVLDPEIGSAIFELRSSATSPWEVLDRSKVVAVHTESKITQDTITPGFAQCKKNGDILPFNPFSVHSRELIEDLGIQNWMQRSPSIDYWQQRWTGSYPAFPLDGLRPALPPVDESIIADCVNNAIASCKSGILDLATSSVEAKETYALFRDTVLKLLKLRRGFLKDFQRYWKRLSNKQRALGVSKQMANYWLQYRYGWLPLVLTLQSAIQAYNADLEKGMTIVGRSRAEVSLKETIQISKPPDYWGAQLSGTVSLSGMRTYRGFCYGRLDDVSRRRFQLDPLVTTWEMVPFSFVVDWFVDIGGFLQASSAYSPTLGLRAGGSIKDEYTVEGTGGITWVTTKSGIRKGSSSYGLAREIVRTYDRFPMEAQLPGFNPRLNASRITDAIALARQLLKLR